MTATLLVTSSRCRLAARVAAAALCALSITLPAGAAEARKRTNRASVACPDALRWGLPEPQQERVVRCLLHRLRRSCRAARLRRDPALDDASLAGALTLAGRADGVADESAGGMRAAAIVETSDLASPRTTVRALAAEGRRALCHRRFRRVGVGSSRVGEPTDDATRIWVVGLR